MTLAFAISLVLWFQPSPLVWHTFDEGMALARVQNKQVLIDVYTDWCGWCKVMDQKTYTHPDISRYLNEKFILIRLNPETDGPVTYRGKQYSASSFAQGIGVNGYPATAFFESGDQMITMVPGYIEASEFLNIIRFIGEKKYNDMTFEDFLKESSSGGR